MGTRRRAVTIAVAAFMVLGSAGVIVWKRVLPASREREAARAFGELAVCIAGAPSATPEEAVVRARRMARERPVIRDLVAPCVAQAEAIAYSDGIRAVAPDLAQEAEHALDALRARRVPGNLVALWRAGERFRWMPPAGSARRDAVVLPEPLLDENIAALRLAMPTYVDLRRELDVQPEGHAILMVGQRSLTVRADGGRALARAAWEPAALDREAARMIFYGTGHAHVVRIGKREITVDGGELVERAADADERAWRKVGDLAAVELPFPEHERWRSCRSRAGSVLTVDAKDAVHVLLVRDEGVDVWGSLARPHPEEPARAGPIHVGCDDAGARVSWSTSEGMGQPKGGMRGDEEPPDERGHHRIVTASCSAAGCTRREVTVGDVGTMWMTSGGWSSPLYRENPDVIDLGARVLLIWSNGAEIHYRLAPLEKLEGAPSPWIAEIARPESGQPLDPRAIAWARWQVLARGEVALVLVQEWGERHAGFLLRFDGGGDARVLVPPPG
jgi:hypothetical protein